MKVGDRVRIKECVDARFSGREGVLVEKRKPGDKYRYVVNFGDPVPIILLGKQLMMKNEALFRVGEISLV